MASFNVRQSKHGILVANVADVITIGTIERGLRIQNLGAFDLFYLITPAAPLVLPAGDGSTDGSYRCPAGLVEQWKQGFLPLQGAGLQLVVSLASPGAIAYSVESY